MFVRHLLHDVSRRGLALAARNILSVISALLAVAWGYLLLRNAVTAEVVGFDFEGTLWRAAIAIREGDSPYPAPNVHEVDTGNPAVYPPLLMLVIAPLTVLPWSIGLGVWMLVLGGAVAGTLRTLGVRDPRCYLFAFVSPFALHGLVLGNATLLLAPLVALAWRWRDRWGRTGLVVGVAIAGKLLVWPLLFWLLGTRRYKAFGAAIAVGGAGTLLPWAAIGFDGFTDYPDLLRVTELVYAPHSFSLTTWFSALGVETSLGSRAALAIGCAIVAAAFYAGRRHADAASLSLAILGAVLASSIVWPFYYTLLLVPVAIARPRFSGMWALLPLFFVAERLPRDHLRTSDLVPGEMPDDVPELIWLFNHADPGLWPAAGFTFVGSAVVVASIVIMRRAERGVADA